TSSTNFSRSLSGTPSALLLLCGVCFYNPSDIYIVQLSEKSTSISIKTAFATANGFNAYRSNMIEIPPADDALGHLERHSRCRDFNRLNIKPILFEGHQKWLDVGDVGGIVLKIAALA